MSNRQKNRRRAALRPHPARDQIIDVMRSYGSPISPTQISRITGGTLGSVAYHVRTLVAVGVIKLAGEGRARGAVEHFYALTTVADDAPLTDPVTSLLSLCGALTVPGEDGAYPRPVALDDRARAKLMAMVNRMRPEVREIAVASTARVTKRGA